MIMTLLVPGFMIAFAKNAVQMRAGWGGIRSKPAASFLEEADRTVIYVTYLILWIALVADQRPAEDPATLVGAVLILAGAILSFLAIRKLGDWHSEYIAPTSGAPLATSGIYAWMRHPMRTGFFIEVSGLVLVLRQPWAVTLWAGTAILLALRTRREERLLLQHYGDAYRAYGLSVSIIPLFGPPRPSRKGRSKGTVLPH